MSTSKPWSGDDVAVLRHKFQIATQMALNCERVLLLIDGLETACLSAAEKDTEYLASLILQMKRAISRSKQDIIGLYVDIENDSMVKSDFVWFQATQSSPAERERVRVLEVLERDTLNISNIDQWLPQVRRAFRAITDLCSHFRDAIKVSLNQAGAPIAEKPGWYSREVGGVAIFGQLIRLKSLESELLIHLCKSHHPQPYEKLVVVNSSWEDGWNSDDEQVSASTEKQIRNTLAAIRRGVRTAFKLATECDPLPANGFGSKQGAWRLDVDLIQKAAK